MGGSVHCKAGLATSLENLLTGRRIRKVSQKHAFMGRAMDGVAGRLLTGSWQH